MNSTINEIEVAAIAAAQAEAEKVFPEIVEGSEPTVLATVAAVFDILRAGVDAGLSKVPFVGSLIADFVNPAITAVENQINAYIAAQATKVDSVDAAKVAAATPVPAA